MRWSTNVEGRLGCPWAAFRRAYERLWKFRLGIGLRVAQRNGNAIREAKEARVGSEDWESAESAVCARHVRDHAPLPRRFARRPIATEAAILGSRLMKGHGEHGGFRRPDGFASSSCAGASTRVSARLFTLCTGVRKRSRTNRRVSMRLDRALVPQRPGPFNL